MELNGSNSSNGHKALPKAITGTRSRALSYSYSSPRSRSSFSDNFNAAGSYRNQRFYGGADHNTSSVVNSLLREQTAELSHLALEEGMTLYSEDDKLKLIPGQKGKHTGYYRDFRDASPSDSDALSLKRKATGTSEISEVDEEINENDTTGSRSGLANILQSSDLNVAPTNSETASLGLNIYESPEQLPIDYRLEDSISSQERPLLSSATDTTSGYQKPLPISPTSSYPSSYHAITSSAQNPTSSLKKRLRIWASSHFTSEQVKKPIKYLPSVVLGTLLNILDGLSYGMILFPLASPIFSHLGPAGLSMFYVSCVVSQLVYSLGGSAFKAGIGSEMIEVVPFFHAMAYTLLDEIGADKPDAVIATTIVAFASSSIVTGMVFFTLGYARLGSLIGFFPRHILVGCIGGVGWFLFVTGIEVSSRLTGSLSLDWDTVVRLTQASTVLKWTIPLALAFLLVFLQRKFTGQPLLVPCYFIGVFLLFHIVVAIVPGISLASVRAAGWVFEAPATSEPWWTFYTLYKFNLVDYVALVRTIPAMFALTFFGILHVPINVPALALSLGQDNIDVDRELVAHGISNALSGLFGSIQNYLVYTNSVLFIRSGADSRLAGLMLAGGTFLVMISGPSLIAYIPVMVVGSLIFLLGIELLNEALVDTWGRVSKFEYFTIAVIIITMGAWDFVYGILVGIILACLTFVIETSQTSAVKAAYTGTVARSTVRRHVAQRRFLEEAGNQIFVLKLSGNVFFGTIARIERAVRDLMDDSYFIEHPIRYLIFDTSAVTGVDYSAAEAFTRMKRLLDSKGVSMLMAGVVPHCQLIRALTAVGLLNKEPMHAGRGYSDDLESQVTNGEEGRMRLFPDLNSGLEWCENQFLKDYYRQRDVLKARTGVTARGIALKPGAGLAAPSSNLYSSSPRIAFLQQAAEMTVQHDPHVGSKWQNFKQPLPVLMQVFQGFSSKNEDFWFKVCPYFKRKEIRAGTVLYSSESEPQGFYLVESGILRADYDLEQGNLYESILAGTTCGELPFFSDTSRTATVTAEVDTVVWQLSKESWHELRNSKPDGKDLANELLTVALKLTVERFTSIMAYVLMSSP